MLLYLLLQDTGQRVSSVHSVPASIAVLQKHTNTNTWKSTAREWEQDQAEGREEIPVSIFIQTLKETSLNYLNLAKGSCYDFKKIQNCTKKETPVIKSFYTFNRFRIFWLSYNVTRQKWETRTVLPEHLWDQDDKTMMMQREQEVEGKERMETKEELKFEAVNVLSLNIRVL